MKAELMTGPSGAFVQLEGEALCPLYMVYMVQRARPAQFLPLRVSHREQGMKVIHHVGERITLKEHFTNKGACRKDIIIFLETMVRVLKVSEEYLLDENHVFVSEEHVFIDRDLREISVMFHPFQRSDFKGACRKLLTYVLGNYFTGKDLWDERWRNNLLFEMKNEPFCLDRLLNVALESRQEAGTEKKPSRIDPVETMGKIRDWFFARTKALDATGLLTKETEDHCLINVCDVDKKIYLDSEGMTLGRDKISPKNKQLGRIHARIFFSEDHVLITDLGSRNGTFLNGEKLKKHTPYEIEKGDIIGFAEEEFMLC
ncbi:MAG: DUF6382 domain-containing protein [Clostridia bacterium]